MVKRSSSIDDRDNNQLALINPPELTVDTRRYSNFRLPEGWRVEEVPRTTSATIDKYYYEPETGRKFRSMREVERYVNGEDVQFYEKSLALAWRNSEKRSVGSVRSRKRIIFDGKMVNYMEGMSESELAGLAEKKTAAKSHYNLPDGWVVEEVPRRFGSIYGDHIDKYYYEPGSGMKFRSLITAQKHVAESNEEMPLSALVAEIKDSNLPLAKAFKLPQSFKRQTSHMKKPTKNGELLPEKVEWVLDSVQENAWKPFVCDRAVPDPLIQEWKERFLQAMNPAT